MELITKTNNSTTIGHCDSEKGNREFVGGIRFNVNNNKISISTWRSQRWRWGGDPHSLELLFIVENGMGKELLIIIHFTKTGFSSFCQCEIKEIIKIVTGNNKFTTRSTDSNHPKEKILIDQNRLIVRKPYKISIYDIPTLVLIKKVSLTPDELFFSQKYIIAYNIQHPDTEKIIFDRHFNLIMVIDDEIWIDGKIILENDQLVVQRDGNYFMIDLLEKIFYPIEKPTRIKV